MNIKRLSVTIVPLHTFDGMEFMVEVVADDRLIQSKRFVMPDDFTCNFDVMLDHARQEMLSFIKPKKP